MSTLESISVAIRILSRPAAFRAAPLQLPDSLHLPLERAQQVDKIGAAELERSRRQDLANGLTSTFDNEPHYGSRPGS